MTSDDDLAVRLQRDRFGLIVGRAADVGQSPCRPAEARVEAAVGVVAGEREVLVAEGGGQYYPGDDDLAVRLQRDRIGHVEATEVGEHLAAGAEARSRSPGAAPAVLARRATASTAQAKSDDLRILIGISGRTPDQVDSSLALFAIARGTPQESPRWGHRGSPPGRSRQPVRTSPRTIGTRLARYQPRRPTACAG